MTDGINNLGALYAALSSAQAEMGSGVSKDAKNPHFHSEYASLAAVLAVAMPSLAKHGLALIQYREGGELITRLGHKDGAELVTSYPLAPTKNTEQGWGSAITYARRYQAMAMLGLAPADDDGNEASQQPRPQQSARSKPQPHPAARKVQEALGGTIDTERGQVFAELAARGMDEEWIEKLFGMSAHEAYAHPTWAKFMSAVESGKTKQQIWES